MCARPPAAPLMLELDALVEPNGFVVTVSDGQALTKEK